VSITTPDDLLKPLGLLWPSPTNPRTRIDETELHSLAESIAQHGVMAPVLLRRISNAADGQPPYEIVAGHRRWQACLRLAEQNRSPHGSSIPALVHDLTDAQVLAMQLVENIQRADLHPLDEAAHYRRMRDDPKAPATVEEIAQAGKVGVSRVYERLSLLNLVDSAREAFLADKLSLKTALQVARLPAAHQAEVAERLSDWAGEPMTPKAAAAFIRDRYMLRLTSAPFDTQAADLLPDTPPCGECPKRTGANPQLFGDITDAETCTDTTCFAAKKAAQRARVVDELRATGYTVLEHDAARDACTPDGRHLKPTLLALDASVPHHLGNADLKVSEVLDKAKVQQDQVLVVDHPNAPAPVVAVGVHTLEGALRRIKAHREQLNKAAEKAARPAPPAPAPAPARTEAPGAAEQGSTSLVDAFNTGVEQEAARQDFVHSLLRFEPAPGLYAAKNAFLLEKTQKDEERRIFRVLAAAEVGALMQRDEGEGLPPFKLGQMLCVLLSWDDGALTLPEAAYLAGVPCPFKPKGEQDPFDVNARSFERKQQWLWGLGDEEANRMAMVLLASQEHRGDSPMDHFTEAVLCGLQIAPAGLLATAQGVVREVLQLGAVQHGQQPTKPAEKAKKPSQATKTPAKPAYRYRNALTGDTWSGRGLQPKWLKVALAEGKTLADFEV
jgi:ParB/RepB/Spo0J family partition protein